MSLPVVFKPAALAEIEAVYAWYELQASGLGAGFLRRVKLTELSISREPLLYPVVKVPLRRATLRQFPYALFYLAEHGSCGRARLFPPSARSKGLAR